MHNYNMYVIGCCGQAECRPWLGHLFFFFFFSICSLFFLLLCLFLLASAASFVVALVVAFIAQLGCLHGLFLRGADLIAQTECHALWKEPRKIRIA